MTDPKRFRQRNGRPDFTKITSMPDVMMRPDERGAIKTFITLGASSHVGRDDSATDRTTNNLRAILSPAAEKRAVAKQQHHPGHDSMPILPFSMTSDSEHSKNTTTSWSAARQPKKSCMKQKNRSCSALHNSTGALEAPAYYRYGMMNKKKESRWRASKQQQGDQNDCKEDRTSSASPLQTPKRLASISVDDMSLPSLRSCQTDDITTNTPISTSSRKGRKLLPPAVPTGLTTKLERKLQKQRGGDALMSPPTLRDIYGCETSSARKDVTRGISDSSPHSIGEELQSAVTSLSSDEKKETDVPLCPDIQDQKFEKKQPTLISLSSHSKLSVDKKKSRERRSRSRSRSRSKSRMSTKQRGRSSSSKGKTAKQRGRSVGKLESRKTAERSESKKEKKERREARKSSRSASPKRRSKSISAIGKLRARNRSASPKRYKVLPAPSKNFRSKSRSKSKSRAKSKSRSQSPARRSRDRSQSPTRRSSNRTSKSASPTRKHGKAESESKSRRRSRSAASKGRSNSRAGKRRSESRSKSPRRSRSKSLKRQQKEKVRSSGSSQKVKVKVKKPKSKEDQSESKIAAKGDVCEDAMVSVKDLLPPKSPQTTQRKSVLSSPHHTARAMKPSSVHSVYSDSKSTERKGSTPTHTYGTSLSVGKMQRRGSTGTLIQEWEEKAKANSHS